ncbi:MAG: ABC transporter permease [Bacteroidota bacterium]
MNKIKLIIKREYITKVRRRSFIVMSLLGPLFLVLVFAIIAFLASINTDNKVIGVYDETSFFVDAFKSDPGIKYVYFPTTGLREVIDTAEARGYYGLIHIPFNADNNLDEISSSIEYFSNKTPLNSVIAKLKDNIGDKIWSLKLNKLGTSVKIVEDADVDVSMRYVSYHGELKNSKIGLMQMATGAMAGIMIYMFIFVYGVQVMRSVIEEKTNRIVEVIISSVKPFELMMGKILGSALVGLTRFATWTILSGVLLSIVKSAFGIDAPNKEIIDSTINPEFENEIHEVIISLFDLNYVLIVGAFAFFFTSGYLLYSAMFASVGAAVDSETDTQQFMLPVTLPLIIALYSGLMVLENPNGPVAFWLSMIPFTSPVVMMARIPFDVPAWELITSMLILVASFVLITILASKIYKTGILMYGNKPTYKELWKWIRHS